MHTQILYQLQFDVLNEIYERVISLFTPVVVTENEVEEDIVVENDEASQCAPSFVRKAGAIADVAVLYYMFDPVSSGVIHGLLQHRYDDVDVRLWKDTREFVEVQISYPNTFKAHRSLK